MSGGSRGQPGWPGRGWVLRAEPQELRFPGLLGDSDDSCDTVILSPTARAVRNVRNVMYLHQEGEEEEEEEEGEEGELCLQGRGQASLPKRDPCAPRTGR